MDENPQRSEAAEQRYKIVWEPQPGKQTDLLRCAVPFIFFGGERKGGKSDAMLGDFVIHANDYGTAARGIVFRRTYQELEEIQRRAMAIFKPIGGSYTVGNRTWTFPNGATLKMRYLDSDGDSASYQGHVASWLGFDELTNWPNPEPIMDLWACLISPEGIPTRCIMTGNPGGRGHGWVKRMFVDPSPSMVPFYDEDSKHWRVFIPSRLKDNQILLASDPTVHDNLMAATAGRPALRRAWLEGDWNVTISGGVFMREWFNQFWTPDTLPAEFQQHIISADLTFKKSATADWVVMQCWARLQSKMRIFGSSMR